MAKLATFLVIIFIAALGYLAILNKETVTLRLGEQSIYEIPKIALILLSTALGALSMLAIIAIKDARQYIESWHGSRQHKKDLKVHELYTKGLDAVLACKDEEATELFTRIIEVDTNNVNALLRLGDIAFKAGDITKAKDFYIKAKEVRPHSLEVLFSLEKVFEAEQRWQEALRYLDNILEIDEENPPALYRKREIYEITKNWESLIDVQHKILKSDILQKEKQKEHKNLLGYKYESGRHYLEKGEIDKAKKIMRAVIRLDKDFIAAHLALAEAYLRNGENEESEEILNKGYELTSSLVFLVRLEDFLISLGEPGKIIGLYQKAIHENPKDTKLQFFLGKLYYRLEMIDHAFETITGIDTATMDCSDLHKLLGEIYQRRMQYDKAAEEFKKSLRIGKPFLVPFCCSNCAYTSKDWLGRCPECKQWNTLSLDLDGTCKI